MLDVERVSMHFGGMNAVDDVTLHVDAGEIRCLVGPNGAGKTTLFNLIAGALRPTAGSIRFKGRDITGLSPRRLSRLGVARKYQAPSVFDEFSVRQNLRIALDGKRHLRELLRRSPGDEARIAAAAAELGLSDRLEVPAGHLAHGQRQWLEIGMVLVNQPELLLLDEPTAGMTSEETVATEGLVRRIAQSRGLTTIVIEHDINFVRALADRITVLHKGRVLLEGSADEVEGNPEVRRVYLGEA